MYDDRRKKLMHYSWHILRMKKKEINYVFYVVSRTQVISLKIWTKDRWLGLVAIVSKPIEFDRGGNLRELWLQWKAPITKLPAPNEPRTEAQSCARKQRSGFLSNLRLYVWRKTYFWRGIWDIVIPTSLHKNNFRSSALLQPYITYYFCFLFRINIYPIDRRTRRN